MIRTAFIHDSSNHHESRVSHVLPKHEILHPYHEVLPIKSIHAHVYYTVLLFLMISFMFAGTIIIDSTSRRKIQRLKSSSLPEGFKPL